MIREYVSADYGLIKKWFEARKLSVPPEGILPKVGFFVEAVGCGFLYQTDSAVGMLDMFITNPDTSKAQRARAVDEIAKALINRARELKCEMIVCTTQHKSIGSKALGLGFKYLGEFSSYCLGG